MTRTKLIRVYATQSDSYRRYGQVFTRRGAIAAVSDALKRPPKGCALVLSVKQFADLERYSQTPNAPIAFDAPDAIDVEVAELQEARATLALEVTALERRRHELERSIADMEMLTRPEAIRGA
jgi:hypothetical protein